MWEKDEELDKLFSRSPEIPEPWLIEKDKLSDEQKNILNDYSFNFIVSGPAGSGKTVLATYKLMDIISVGKHEKSLFIMFCNSLKEFVRSGIENALNIYGDKELESMGIDKINVDRLNIHNRDSKKCKDLIEKKDLEYIIIDEVQDIEKDFIEEVVNKFKNFMFFGDNEQKLYNKGISMNELYRLTDDRIHTKHNINEHYRVPKKIMQFASGIINRPSLIDLCKKDDNNEKIMLEVKKFDRNTLNDGFKEEIEYTLKKIKDMELKNVGILINNNERVEEAMNYLDKCGIDYYYKLNEDTEKLNFNDINKPVILTYHSSKGLEFENVFLLRCGKEDVYSTLENDSNNHNYRRALFVACTRAKEKLFITYSGEINDFMKSII